MEFSSLCNARCPLCPRNVNGYPLNRGYEETNLSLDLVKAGITPDLIKRLSKGILINGNFGDFTANLESLDIIRYFKEHNPDISVEINTNGSARNADFWRELGRLRPQVWFALDGLEDTHHLYRQDTDWQRIIDNARIFRLAGGRATWKMIRFDHNRHQIRQCQDMAHGLGMRFELVDHGRNQGPAFDRKGDFSHWIGQPAGPNRWEDMVDAIHRVPDRTRYSGVACLTQSRSSIYIGANGHVYPCCWTGHSPETYHKGFMGFINRQIAPLIKDNDLHEHDLGTCMAWFSEIEKAWSRDSYEEGRMMMCDRQCGTCHR
jgi:MoaA/NifB/PqqE/SkfB family radical SAM enzyme